MTKFMFSALCAAAMVTSVSAQGGKDMLSKVLFPMLLSAWVFPLRRRDRRYRKSRHAACRCRFCAYLIRPGKENAIEYGFSLVPFDKKEDYKYLIHQTALVFFRKSV